MKNYMHLKWEEKNQQNKSRNPKLESRTTEIKNQMESNKQIAFSSTKVIISKSNTNRNGVILTIPYLHADVVIAIEET